ncbi:MAG: ABC transporter ATP-binding protein/permease [Clostridium sp.]|nr:ABC transporter ATP-binding protein/permease [Clostridium sp.]
MGKAPSAKGASSTEATLPQARLERLRKKYASKRVETAGRRRGLGGPGGPPGRGVTGGGKPQNVKKTLRRLWAYLSADALKLAAVFVCVVAGTAAMLAASYLLRPLINHLTDGSGVAVLLRGILTMAGVYAVGIAAQYLQQRIMIGIAQKALMQLRNDLFRKIQKLPVRFYDTNSHGDIMSRFTNDVDAVGEMMNNTVVQMISGLISLVGTFALMVYTNIWLTLVTVAMVPVTMLAGQMVAGSSRRFYKAQQEALGTLNGFIEETVTGQKVIKVFCHEAVAEEEFGFLNHELRDKQIKAQFFGGLMGPVMGNIGQISYSLTVIVGGILCVARGFDLGGLTVFTGYSRQFSRPINELSMQVNTVFSALAGAERVFDVMDQEPEPEDPPSACRLRDLEGTQRHRPGEVTLNHVTFGYAPETVILKDVSLYAKPGQKIAFVGSTGAGKTTIANLITRFYDIDEGTITVNGVDIRSLRRKELRRSVAMVLQDTHLFTGTVLENIRYGRLEATDQEVEQAARTAGAHSFILRLEHGYDTMIEGDGANLSQGQRQLLNIARAAISKAPILILDEATSSVDTRTEKNIERGMDRLMATRTTLVIAHRLSTVRNANAIIVLENGEVIERGDHEELLARKGRYYNLHTGLAQLE